MSIIFEFEVMSGSDALNNKYGVEVSYNRRMTQSCILKDKIIYSKRISAIAAINDCHSSPLCSRLQRNSLKYGPTVSRTLPLTGTQRFNPLQSPSMVFVWHPDTGSTKLREWFTVKWRKPSMRSIALYPAQPSV